MILKNDWQRVACCIGLLILLTPGFSSATGSETVQYAPPVVDQGLVISDNATVCQRIKPTYNIFSRRIKLAISSGEAITLTLTLRENDSGSVSKPSTTISTYLATSSINYLDSGEMLTFTRHPFDRADQITAGAYYWICLTSPSASAKWIYGQPGTYDNGFMIYDFNGTTFNSISDGDFGFEFASSGEEGGTTLDSGLTATPTATSTATSSSSATVASASSSSTSSSASSTSSTSGVSKLPNSGVVKEKRNTQGFLVLSALTGAFIISAILFAGRRKNIKN